MRGRIIAAADLPTLCFLRVSSPADSSNSLLNPASGSATGAENFVAVQSDVQLTLKIGHLADLQAYSGLRGKDDGR